MPPTRCGPVTEAATTVPSTPTSPRYGMTDLAPQPGFSATFPYWGFQKSTANDLDRLINYTLTQIAPADTAAIVDQLQHVASNQQWGVGGGSGDVAGQ